jgi:hypothetical protein
VDCVQYVLGASSECILFLCDLIDVIAGGDGECAAKYEAIHDVQPLIDVILSTNKHHKEVGHLTLPRMAKNVHSLRSYNKGISSEA